MRRFYRYLRPYALQVFITLVLVLMQSLAELALPSLMADIVDNGVVRGDTALIWRTGGRMLLIALVGAVCALVSGYLSAKVSSAYGRDLRSTVFSHATSLSLYEFDKIGTASLITRTTNDVSQVQMVVLMSLRIFMSAPMMLIGGIMLAFSKEPRLSLLLVIILPVLAVVIFVGRRRCFPCSKCCSRSWIGLTLCSERA